MSTSDQGPRDQAGVEPEWKRKRRLAEIFGDVLPESTADDREEPGAHGSHGPTSKDSWLRAQVPPHHGKI